MVVIGGEDGQTMVCGKPAKVKKKVDPTPPYPDRSEQREYEGMVILQALVTQEGAVESVSVIIEEPKDIGLADATIKAVKQWRYKPAIVDKKRVASYAEVYYRFDVGGLRPEGTPDEFVLKTKKPSKEEQVKIDRELLGSEKNPVRCAHPEGERAYLDRLRCESGKPPKYDRSGSVGEGPYDTILDRYIVTCPGEKKEHIVLMDMYHDYVELLPVPGFSIVKPRGAE